VSLNVSLTVENFLIFFKMRQSSGDRKGARKIPGRPSRNKKRPAPPNRHSFESETALTSVSAKKLKTDSVEVPVNAAHGYRLITFLSFFSSLSEMVKCKECNGNLTFSESSIRGLGFKLVINCTNCEPRYINSCPLIKNVYEINRRIVFAMRILGVGYNGIQKFCGIMDLPKIFSKKVYYDVVSNALKSVADLLFSEAVVKEKELTKNAENVAEPRRLIVSGDGTWRKRGFSSLQGVTTLIGHHSGKVLDLLVKYSYCKQCEYWKPKMNTMEYKVWMESHADECSANHIESAGKMEVDAAVEMFLRSEELHNIRYSSYIGDGDSKTFKGIVESQPYGEDCIVVKKECSQNNNESLNALIYGHLL